MRDRKIASLRYRVECKSPTTSYTNGRDAVQTYPTTYATRWADIEPVSSSEIELAEGLTAITQYDVTLRYFPEVEHDHILVEPTFGTLNVASVTHDMTNQITTCRCRIAEVD